MFGAVPFLSAVLARRNAFKLNSIRRPYRFHCYDQELMNLQLVLDNFTWVRFPSHGVVPPSDGRPQFTVRYLEYVRWPRDFAKRPAWTGATAVIQNMSKLGSKQSRYLATGMQFVYPARQKNRACFYHPWIFNKYGNKSAYADEYIANGMWYL